MVSLKGLTASKLLQAKSKAESTYYRLNDALIEAGRGNETCTDTLKGRDPLSLAYASAHEKLSALRAEERRRLDYRGDLRRCG